MDHKKLVDDQRWLVSNSGENAAELREDDGDDEEETLSLSDLPLIHQWRKENKEDEEDDSKNCNATPKEEEFDFCSLSKESEMCAADEVFFQGQILPLRRHSVSSEKGSLLHHYDGNRYRSRSISRSDSMDHYYSSRSSSISSGQSSTSGSSSATASTSTSTAARYIKPKHPPRNQFHSHPSPSPRLHFPSGRQGGSGGAAATNHRNSIKKSSIWNVLRLGLVMGPPEIAFQDLKARSSTNSRSFGSRNSNSSSISGGGEAAKSKKTGRRLLGGGCRCAADAVAPARVVIIKRSASENVPNDVVVVEGKSKGARIETTPSMKKKQLSHHRTFEWLKQLSVEGAADEA